MTTLDTIESLDSDDELERATAAQALINSGDAWRLEGSVGRACMDLIKAGHCMVGTEFRKDYYGNTIPSRTVLQDGSKGTRSFVVERQGEDWAQAIEAVA